MIGEIIPESCIHLCEEPPIYRAFDTEWTDVVETVLPQCRRTIETFTLSIDDSEFLYTEMNQVIIGKRNQLPGNLRELRASWTRNAAWSEATEAGLGVRGSCVEGIEEQKALPSGHLFTDATKSAHAIYDYVFIDEAQDLLPAAIRMCMGLAKDKRNVFLTADRNQSIYNAGFSWRQG